MKVRLEKLFLVLILVLVKYNVEASFVRNDGVTERSTFRQSSRGPGNYSNSQIYVKRKTNQKKGEKIDFKI